MNDVKGQAWKFFERLSESERAELEALGPRRSFPKGALLMFQDEFDQRLVLLLAGRVKVSRASPEGRELLLAIRDGGDLLGELAFIDGRPRTATVTALEPVQALLIHGSTFRDYLERTPNVAVVLLESVAARFREATVKQLEFAAADTMGRLASRIVELIDRYGEPSEAGPAVTMPISLEDLAGWTGASRSGVTQALQRFRELGWLTTERRVMVVHDLDALRERAA